MARQKVVEKERTIYPEIDPTILPEEGEGQQEEPSQQEENFWEFVDALGDDELKLQVYRWNGGQIGNYCGFIGQSEADPSAPKEVIRNRFGGGDYVIRFVNPEDGKTEQKGPFSIEGPPKGTPAPTTTTAPGINLTLPPAPIIPPGTSDMATVLTVVMQSNRDMLTMMQNSQVQTSTTLLEAMKAMGGQNQSPVTASVRDTIEIVKLLRESDKKTGVDWKFWLEVGERMLDRVQGLIPGAEPTTPLMYVVNAILPQVKEVLGTIAARMSANAGFQQPQQPIHPNLVPGHQHAPVNAPRPPATPATGPTPAENQNPNLPPPELRQRFREQFEAIYLPKLLQWSAQDLEPYEISQTFTALIPDTRDLLPLIDLNSPEEFYQRYPATLQFKLWFDELFGYLLNPGSVPQVEEEQQPQVPDDVIVDVPTPAPKNGRAVSSRKGKEA